MYGTKIGMKNAMRFLKCPLCDNTYDTDAYPIGPCESDVAELIRGKGEEKDEGGLLWSEASGRRRDSRRSSCFDIFIF